MLIAIHGYYGYGNLGDDLMLHLLLEQLATRFPTAEFRVLCHGEAEASLIPCPPNVPMQCARVATWSDRYQALRDVDLLVFGGGTCLHRFGFCGLYNNLAARALGVPVVWLGVGADDVGSGKSRWKAKIALRTCNEASWRDQPSAAIATSLAPRFSDSVVADDLAFLLLESPTLGVDSHSPNSEEWAANAAGNASRRFKTDATPSPSTLIVGWRDFRGYLDPAKESQAIEHGAEAIRNIVRSNGFRQVRVIDVADLVDNDQNARLTSLLQQKKVDATHDVGLTMEEKIDAIRGADGALFARLHGLFLAQLFDVPSIAVGYASKLDNFGRLFERPPVVRLDDVARSDRPLTDAFQKQWDQPTPWLATKREHVAAARRHFEVVVRQLGKRQGCAA